MNIKPSTLPDDSTLLKKMLVNFQERHDKETRRIPLERYQWPLGFGLVLALFAWIAPLLRRSQLPVPAAASTSIRR